MINKIKNNLSDNMLLYTLIAICLGTFAGYSLPSRFFSKLILPIVLIMIYPMMLNISLSSLKKIKHSKKVISEAMILNFIYAPLLMWFLTDIFITNPKIKLSMMMLSIAPASSMGLGYIGLAEGHILSGVLIVASAFLLSVIVYPLLGHYFALGYNIPVPLTLILKNVTFVLILPLLLGIITREYIERRKGKESFKKIKPYASAITLLSLYILIFLIFASKSMLILQNYTDIIKLLPVAIIYYGLSILFTLLINKKILNLEYGQHQSIVFTSISKNIALTIAILITIFKEDGPYLAIFPAIMSLFQAPFLMTYLKFSKKVKKWFNQ